MENCQNTQAFDMMFVCLFVHYLCQFRLIFPLSSKIIWHFRICKCSRQNWQEKERRHGFLSKILRLKKEIMTNTFMPDAKVAKPA
jgi:membrane-anchored glycerophosphoryl diester phosphodiesterase (GDPDase)